MEGQERVGPRVCMPQTFPAAQKFLEMRLLGAFPANTVFAVLYAFIEKAFALRSAEAISTLSTLLESEMRLFPLIETAIGDLNRDFQENKPPSILRSIEDLSIMSATVCSKLNLRIANDYGAFQACIEVCKQLHVRGVMLSLQQEINVGEPKEVYSTPESCAFEIYLCGGKGKLYQLHKTMTVDSFLWLPCGHIMLKRNFLATVAQNAQSYSCDADSVVGLQIKCPTCTYQLQHAEISLALSGTEGQPSHMMGHCDQFFGTRYDKNEQCDQCHLPICSICAVVQICTTGQPACPRCGKDFLEALRTRQFMRINQEWLQNVLDIALQTYNERKKTDISSQMSTSSNRALANSSNAAGNVCRECQKPITQAGLCPNQCLCLACDLYFLFLRRERTALCVKCNSTRKKLPEHKCSLCKQALSQERTFFACGVCNVWACVNCAKSSLRDRVRECSVTKKRHELSEDRSMVLRDSEPDCALF